MMTYFSLEPAKNPSLTTESSPGNKKLGKSIENLLEFGVKEKPRGRPVAAESKEVTGRYRI